MLGLKVLKDWIFVGKVAVGIGSIDIANFVDKNERFYYIKIKDGYSPNQCDRFLGQETPGADIDAVAALGSSITEIDMATKNIKGDLVDELSVLNQMERGITKLR
jgi:hypothetical protein